MSVFLFEKEYCLLEPCEGKLSRTVLRGESTRKGVDLPDPTLATKLYYHYLKNRRLGKTPPNCQFNIINFVDVEYSRRVNPIQAKYIPNLAAASETAETLLESDRKSTRLNSSHANISYAVFCLKKKKRYTSKLICMSPFQFLYYSTFNQFILLLLLPISHFQRFAIDASIILIIFNS